MRRCLQHKEMGKRSGLKPRSRRLKTRQERPPDPHPRRQARVPFPLFQSGLGQREPGGRWHRGRSAESGDGRQARPVALPLDTGPAATNDSAPRQQMARRWCSPRRGRRSGGRGGNSGPLGRMGSQWVREPTANPAPPSPQRGPHVPET